MANDSHKTANQQYTNVNVVDGNECSRGFKGNHFFFDFLTGFLASIKLIRGMNC